MGAHVQLGEIGFDRHFYALAHERMRRDPGRLVAGTLRRAFLYLGPIRGRAPNLWVHRFAMLAALAALCLGSVRPALLLPGLVWAAQGAMLVGTLLIDRYRFPTEWCVVVAAAFGIAGMARRFGERRALALCVAGSFLLARGLAVAATRRDPGRGLDASAGRGPDRPALGAYGILVGE